MLRRFLVGLVLTGTALTPALAAAPAQAAPADGAAAQAQGTTFFNCLRVREVGPGTVVGNFCRRFGFGPPFIIQGPGGRFRCLAADQSRFPITVVGFRCFRIGFGDDQDDQNGLNDQSGQNAQNGQPLG
jgi:hypothetical protein